MPTPPSLGEPRPTVTAVVVTHHGDRWLPGLRAALSAQTRHPDLLLGADTTGPDGAGDLSGWLGADRVASLDPRTGFGAAVRAALALETGPPADWVWLLHDDCAPEPEALEQLLAETARDAQVAVAGPKVLGMVDRRLLLEVGVTIARGGRRETGLERREHDQGQHDGVRPVLAVGTAGMLVRRDVWDALGGLDPALPLLRDDVDLGWRANLAGHRVVVVTDAVVHHAEAGSHRRRRVHAAGGRLHRLDRRHALYVLLANLPLHRLVVALPWLFATTLSRALALLAGKRPGHAADEALALLAVVGRPDRLVRARLARRRTRAVPARSVLPLLAHRGAGVRHGLENLSVFLGTRAGAALGGRHRAAPVETGPVSEDADDLPATGAGGAARRLLLRPGVLVTAGLGLLALVAARGLLGGGRLMGGALLPAPASATGLWQTYVTSWHPVGLGSDTEAPPYLAALALLGTVLRRGDRAVDLLLLGAVPLAGLTGYLLLRRLTRSALLRAWGAVAYALLPPLLGAVATGRIGTAVLAVLVPVLALACLRAAGHQGRPGSWRATWAAGLVLAVVAAFVPLAWVLAALIVLGAAATLPPDRRRGALARAGAVAALPPLLLLPWLPAVVAEPQLLLLEAGLAGPGLSDRDLDGLDLLLLRPGGPGLPPSWLAVGVVVGGLAGLLRPDRRRGVLLAWAVALAGLAGALALARAEVRTPTLETEVAAWPGPLLLLAGAAMVVAAVVGATGARGRMARASFGWRQAGGLLAVALALLGPALTALWWVGTGAGDPLERRDPVLLPAFVAAEGDSPARPRTLVVRSRPDGTLTYAVLRSDGPRTGAAELTPPPDRRTGLDDAVADLASGRGGDAAARLVPYGVRFVLVTRPAERSLVRAVDTVPGVVRLSGQRGAILWRVDYPTGRLRLLPAGAPVVEPDGSPPQARVLPAGQVRARPTVPDGPAGRLVVLADAYDDGWRARLGGEPLTPRRYAGWAQAFELPAGSGRLRIGHDADHRPTLLWVQLGLLVLVVVLALPQARARLDDPEGEAAEAGDAGLHPEAAGVTR
jgi:GT2 family glycosyltransferase